MPPALADRPLGRRVGSRRAGALLRRAAMACSLIVVSSLVLAMFALCCCPTVSESADADTATTAAAPSTVSISAILPHDDHVHDDAGDPADDCASPPSPIAPLPVLVDDLAADTTTSLQQPGTATSSTPWSFGTAALRVPVPHLLCVMRT